MFSSSCPVFVKFREIHLYWSLFLIKLKIGMKGEQDGQEIQVRLFFHIYLQERRKCILLNCILFRTQVIRPWCSGWIKLLRKVKFLLLIIVRRQKYFILEYSIWHYYFRQKEYLKIYYKWPPAPHFLAQFQSL